MNSAMSGTHLFAARRARELDALASETVDVLVVGGGVTGTGAALDAAARGLSVALVERKDLANGTSRWSSKLVHGGLRYLAHGDVGLALESARERAVLMGRTAPHLVRPLPFVFPLTARVSRRRERLYVGGVRAGELLRVAARTPRKLLPAARRIGREEAMRWLPTVRTEGLRGGVLSWDGQLLDDARLVVALARTAAGLGARILPYVSATRLTGDGATLRDERTGAELTVAARAVVNATGVWADQLDPEVTLRPSRGSHLVVRASSLGEPRAAATVPVPGEPNRFLLVLPQPDGLAYIGLTDEPTTEVVDEPATPAEDRDFLLAAVNRILDRPLTDADVVGTYAGLRPLVAAGRTGAGTADLSRRHLVRRNADGVVTVTGGKLTTYRKMAEDAVDALALTDRPSRTRRLPLVGAGPVPAGVPARLVHRYGSEAARVAAAGALEPVAPGLPVLAAELAWGVAAEGALTVDDLLARRTRLALVPADAEAARPAAERALAERNLAAPRCR